MALIRNPSITEGQLQTLRHMLGVDRMDNFCEPYRNHYAACPDSPSDRRLRQMESLGLVEYCGDAWQYRYYRATEAGREAALESHRKAVAAIPKSKRVYRAWLSVSDVLPVTFKEFLTDPEYKDIRKRA
jgi:hypothetical protein